MYIGDERTLFAEIASKLVTTYVKVFLISSAVVLSVTLPLVDASSTNKKVTDEVIPFDDSYTDWLYDVDEGDILSVNGGASHPIDIYIFSNDSYRNGYLGSSGFSPAFKVQNTTYLGFSWRCPDDQQYVMVFDNAFNGEGADPTGPVTINYIRNQPALDTETDAWINWDDIICTLGIIIVGVLILVIYFVLRKKRASPPMYQQNPKLD